MNFILDFKDDLTQEYVDAYLANHGCTKLQTFSSFNHVYLVSCNQAPTVDSDLLSVVADEDHSVDLHAESYRNFDNTTEENWWKMAVISNPNFDSNQQELLERGSRVTIYLMDSGVDQSHPDFAGRNITMLHTFNGDFVDRIGHGTSLASLMVGNTAGISNAKVKVVKITDQTATTKTSDLIAAFDAIISDYTANGSAVSIVNISWNIARNTYIESKIDALMNRGIFVVVAAGNEGQAISNTTPAAMMTVITVGAFNQDLEPCSFSNYSGPGGDLDGWAPGQQMYVAQLGGGFGFTQGTSCAAAVASATLAYNLDYFMLTEEGQWAGAGVVIDSDNVRLHRQVIFPRQDILMLEGQYADSLNSIATILTKGSLADRDSSTVTAAIVSNQQVGIRVFTDQEVTSTTFSVPLLDGLSLNRGYIVGQVGATPERYTYESVATVTHSDGQQRNVSIKIYVLPNEPDAAELPPDDELKILLAMTPGSTCMMTVTSGAQCMTSPGCTSCINWGFASAKNPGSCYCCCQ